MLLGTSFLAARDPVRCPLGLDQFQSGDYVRAQDSLWECVESRLGNENHAFYLALTYRALKNYHSGLRKTESALKELPENIDLLYLAAYLHYRQNDIKQSMVLLSKAYRIAPEDWRLHQLFALNYISFNMLETAKLSLLKAISLNPKNAELYYELARLYFTLGSFVNSIKASQHALEIFPNYPEVYYNLALSYEGNGNSDLAITSFQKAIDLNRKYKRQDEWPLIDFAVYRRMEGAPEAALPLLEEALAINPHSPKANYQMGELLQDMKRYAEAKKYLEIAIDLDPCNARALYGLAFVTRTLGDAPRSLELLKRFQEVDAATKDPSNAGRDCRAGQ